MIKLDDYKCSVNACIELAGARKVEVVEAREVEDTPASRNGMSEAVQLAAADPEAEGVPPQSVTWGLTG
jgi:hypothetical protein